MYGPPMYETSIKPVKHAGCLIYERIQGHVWDVVRNGVCLSQRAGLGGAREAAEMFRRMKYKIGGKRRMRAS